MNNGWIRVSPMWLQKKKDKLGLTYEAMAKITQIDRNNLRKYAIGLNNMKLETKKKIYNAIKLYENE